MHWVGQIHALVSPGYAMSPLTRYHPLGKPAYLQITPGVHKLHKVTEKNSRWVPETSAGYSTIQQTSSSPASFDPQIN